MSAFKRIDDANGVVYFRSELLSCPHGFSTRIGGVSHEPHTSSLNLAFGRGDGDMTVLENLRFFSEAVGIEPESVVSVRQVHSARVVYVDRDMRGNGYYKPSTLECDGYVTNLTGISLGVKTADCVPILFEDPEAGVIGAVHAGWRGTAAGIAGICVNEMEKLGAKPEKIRAAIGPAIHSCCYEVGEDFFNEVESLAGSKAAERYIRIPPDDTQSGSKKLYADIVGLNAKILTDTGLDPANIDVCELCTCHSPELFYSHRYSHGLRGTMLSVISLGSM